MQGWRRWVVIALIAFVAAIGGVLASRTYFSQSAAESSELHDFVHQSLDLDAAQLAKIEALEQRFAVRRQALELEMRSDNARLADAIEAEHGYGPRVAAAVDRSHMAMGELQKETLAHVFAMRQVLRPDQAEKFDKAVVKALTVDVR